MTRPLKVQKFPVLLLLSDAKSDPDHVKVNVVCSHFCILVSHEDVQNATIPQYCAPTCAAEMEEKENFYGKV